MTATAAPIPAKTKAATWRDVLPVHPAADLFPRMTPDELKALGEDIKKNGLKSPIVLWSPGSNEDKLEFQLLDGRNRLDAMEAAGIQLFDSDGKELRPRVRGFYSYGQLVRHLYAKVVTTAITFGGGSSKTTTERGTDPYAYVISANIHRRHLTAEQKRDLIAKLLKATPEQSNRRIAEATKSDHKTVAAVRAEKEATGEIPQLTKTVGKDGKQRKQPARKTTAKVKADQVGDTGSPDRPAAAEVAARPWGEVERLRARVKQLESQSAEKDRLIKSLNAEIAEKGRRIRELSAENRRLNRAVDQFAVEREVERALDAPDDAGGIEAERTKATPAAPAPPVAVEASDDDGIPDFLRRGVPHQ